MVRKLAILQVPVYLLHLNNFWPTKYCVVVLRLAGTDILLNFIHIILTFCCQKFKYALPVKFSSTTMYGLKGRSPQYSAPRIQWKCDLWLNFTIYSFIFSWPHLFFFQLNIPQFVNDFIFKVVVSVIRTNHLQNCRRAASPACSVLTHISFKFVISYLKIRQTLDLLQCKMWTALRTKWVNFEVM